MSAVDLSRQLFVGFVAVLFGLFVVVFTMSVAAQEPSGGVGGEAGHS